MTEAATLERFQALSKKADWDEGYGISMYSPSEPGYTFVQNARRLHRMYQALCHVIWTRAGARERARGRP